MKGEELQWILIVLGHYNKYKTMWSKCDTYEKVMNLKQTQKIACFTY